MPYGSRSARTNPLPKDWPTIRARILNRDRSCRWPISAIPGDLCGSMDHLEVDHIGGPNDHGDHNLRALCRTHHRARSSGQGGTAAAAKRPRRRRPPEPHPGMIT